MELLLWLWLYDKRWLLNIKPSFRFYIALWFLPILTNIYLTIFGIFSLSTVNFSKCSSSTSSFIASPKPALAIKTLLSFLSFICSILLIKNIMIHDKEEKPLRDKLVKEELNDCLCTRSDFFIRRKSLNTISGIILLGVGILEILYSIHFFMNNNKICTDRITGVFLQNALFELIFAIPILCVFALAASVKVSAFIASYTCPSLVIAISRMFSDNSKMKKNLKFKKVIKENSMC